MNVQSKKEAEGKVSLTHDTHMMRRVTECLLQNLQQKDVQTTWANQVFVLFFFNTRKTRQK